MSRTLIRGATILAMGGPPGDRPFTGDLLVDGDRIAGIGEGLPAEGAAVIDGRDRLVMPGLVNGHLHSSEQLFKGRYQKLPLELWLLYAYPPLMGAPVPERLLRLRTLLVAMESLKGGATTICDCFFDPPTPSLDRLGVVFEAYEAAGIRANVACSVINIPMLDSLPFAREVVPEDQQALLAPAGPMLTAEAHAGFCEAAFAAFDGRAGRLRVMVSPSAPQRCTPDLLLACRDLALRHGVPLHTHVLETKTQAVTGQALYGQTLVEYMAGLGLLVPNLAVAHGVWLTEGDMALLGAAGASVVHNALSNHKLGSGLAPLRRLAERGVNLALGTDGASSNDSLRLFDVMRIAALAHSLTGPDYSQWLSAAEVLAAATIGGARSAMLADRTGSLEVGKQADLLVLRTDGLDWAAVSDVRGHLVFAENGSAIERVFVAGREVVRDGRLTLVDEQAVLAELRMLVPAYLAEHARIEERNRIFAPAMAEIHRRATLADIGIDRWAGDAPAWPGANGGRRG